MKELDLLQGSNKWKEWRKGRLTATCAASILELSPFKSRYELWREMVGFYKLQPLTLEMERGNQLEPIARSWYEKQKGESYAPLCVEHDTIPYLGASLDGISVDRKRIIEIKCGVKSFRLAQNDIIPDWYIAQIQHIMLVTGLDQIDYVAFNGSEGIVIPVKRDDAFIDRLVKECEVFWHCVENFISPLTVIQKYEVVV